MCIHHCIELRGQRTWDKTLTILGLDLLHLHPFLTRPALPTRPPFPLPLPLELRQLLSAPVTPDHREVTAGHQTQLVRQRQRQRLQRNQP
jgi:hypothetical protein